jgi:lipopolysaccharide export system permease protein
MAVLQREAETIESMRNDRGLAIHWIEFYKKFSLPAGAFSFIFLASALGLMVKRSGQAVGFMVGLIISVIYWTLLLGGQTVGMRMNASPFWAMWLPNISALSIGLVLTLLRLSK